MIDGITSRPFSATTIAPVPIVKDNKKREEIIKISRSKYAHSVKSVEEEINRWAGNQDIHVNNVFQKSNTSRSAGETKLYDVKCSNCGKDTKVIFPPEPGRAVYCKSCLKKNKDQGQVANLPKPDLSRPDKEPKGTSALGDLGIEFGPSAGSIKPDLSAGGQTRNKDHLDGIENVSFHNLKSNKNQRHFDAKQDKPHRKEINLSELKKALEESLEKKTETLMAEPNPGSTDKKNIIKPGETVKL
jgi:CxxC-x17-CxxC domain-containing protein